MRKVIGCLILLAGLLAEPANAQQQVIATCGTFPRLQALGGAGIVAVDQNGSLCTTAAVTLSGTGANNADNVAPVATGLTPTVGYNYVFDGANWDRWTGAVAATQSGTWNIGTVTAVTAITNALPAGANVIGAVTQSAGPWSVNQTQLNGVAALAGNGATGTGSPRVTLSNDNTIPTGWPSAANQTSVIGTLAAGTSATNSLLTGVVYTATAPTLTNAQQIARQADTAGSQYTNTEGRKATYSAAGNFAPAASATDVFTLFGSATKTVRVNQISCTGIASTAVTTNVRIFHRTSANSGGTSTAPGIDPHDSGNAAATATPLQYTANPTTGGGAATRQAYMFFPLATALGNGVSFDFGTRNGQGMVIRGTAQGVAVNLAGATVTGGAMSCNIEWTEE